MRMIVATFATEAAANQYQDSLRDGHGIAEDTVSTAIIGAYGEQWDGHRVVAAWVRRELESDVRGLAEAHGGLLHDVSGTVIIPRWVQDFMAARIGP
jgi:hypothetical protein